MVSVRAQIGWSTHGHSAVDVNVYCSGGPGTDAVRGNVENTDIGKFLMDYIDVDVSDITKELREKLVKKIKTTEQELLFQSVKEGRVPAEHWTASRDDVLE
jgi:alkaline phosphatase